MPTFFFVPTKIHLFLSHKNPSHQFPPFLRIGPANIQQNIHLDQGIVTISLHISNHLPTLRDEGYDEFSRWNEINGIQNRCGLKKCWNFRWWCKMHNPLRCLFLHGFCGMKHREIYIDQRLWWWNPKGCHSLRCIRVSDCLQSNILSSHQVV